MKDEPGTYVLVMRLPRRRVLRIGGLGTFPLEPGWYLYAGSARGPGGVRGRVNRHLRRDKRLHWHVDYLATVADVAEVWFTHDGEISEHDVIHMLTRMDGIQVPVRGFGSTDCRAGCTAHLLHVSTNAHLTAAMGRLREALRNFLNALPVREG